MAQLIGRGAMYQTKQQSSVDSRTGCVMSSPCQEAGALAFCEYGIITTELPAQVPSGGVLLLARGRRWKIETRVCGVVPARRVVGAAVAYRVDNGPGTI